MDIWGIKKGPYLILKSFIVFVQKVHYKQNVTQKKN